MITATLILTIVPALPPSGPIRGGFECLLEGASSRIAADIYVAENEKHQVRLGESFPVDKEEIASITFWQNRAMSVENKAGSTLLRLIPVKGGLAGNWWSVRRREAEGYSWKEVGVCVGSLEGRGERPVKLMINRTDRVEVEGVDQ